MRTGSKALISGVVFGALTIPLGVAPAAAADESPLPGITTVQPAVRYQRPGDVEINTSRTVHFARLYPDFASKGVYHHGHHAH
ncbi:hypothetical protein [Mycobacterium sp. URHB0021]|jgi:hypothetical protein